MHNHAGRWVAAALALGFLVLVAGTARATWPHDPYVNVPLSNSFSTQIDAAVVADGAGGAIVVWCESRGYPQYVCAQRVSADGDLLWDPAGVVISRNGPDFSPDYTNAGSRPVIVSDGAGGAIVAWGGWGGPGAYRTYILAQRVTADGAVMWGSDGVLLCGADGYRTHVTIAEDGAGGAVVAWGDYRDDTDETNESDVYAQKVSAGGVAQWAADGVAVSAGVGYQYDPVVAGDGAGGAIIAWADVVVGGQSVRAQRILASGTMAWALAGVPACTNGQYVRDPVIVTDDAGGAFVAWTDFRGAGQVIRAQRLDAAGTAHWLGIGASLSTSSALQSDPAIAGDGAGGAIVAWRDYRGSDIDIYAQRVSAAGVWQWAAAGLPVATERGDQWPPIVAADGTGGALITWSNQSGTPTSPDDIFAQRVSATGSLLWSRGGAAICIADDAQFPGGIVGDGAGGAIVAWSDNHNGFNTCAFAQWIDGDGATFRSEPVIGSVRDIAPDQGGRVRIRWSASNLDRPEAGMAMYGVWREVAAAKDGVPTWESLGVVLARGDADYTFTAATFADSCAAGAAPSTFMVDYHLLAWGEAWDSAPVTGWSVDNLAPARPANLHLTADGRLAWDTAVEPDFRQFTVYGSSVGRLDDSATVVARTPNNGLDVGGLAFPYLLVTSGDIHDNESIASGTSALSGVEVSPVAGLRLHASTPNPFNPRTTIAFELPRAGSARLDVYDAGGRLMRRLVDADLPAGRHEALWDGRTDDGGQAASGAYLVLFTSGDGVLRRKMTLLR
ncbi:MAG: hypothetical protein IPH48_15680 [bacterium]|nr:hypothetical protein [bacterium]